MQNIKDHISYESNKSQRPLNMWFLGVKQIVREKTKNKWSF